MNTSLDIIRHKLQDARNAGKTWRVIGAEWGITGGMAFRIAVNNYDPKEPDIRLRLGLPAYAMTQVCPDCGAVHKIEGVCIAKSRVTVTVVQMTAEELAKVDKPVTIVIKQPKPKGSARPRASINLADPQSAAKTIRKKMDPQTLAALLELLEEGQR